MTDIKKTSPQELYNRWKSGEGIDLIDVRAPIAFNEGHVPFARWVSFDQLKGEVAGAGSASEKPLYVICQIGKRSEDACKVLAESGHKNVFTVEGGTQGWREAGLPVIGCKVGMSLMRQVQITAGSLTFIGTALGFFVHPIFFVVPAFIGAGLAFAGLTNTCGMAMLLSKMPWNQRVSGTRESQPSRRLKRASPRAPSPP
jgi:rhodanese-related sulfurtransferase